MSTPVHTSVNPATIEDCVIDSWRGAAALSYQLRGPLLVLNNQFSNGSNPVWQQPVGKACNPYKCSSSDGPCEVTPCPQPMDYAPWPQTNGIALFAVRALPFYVCCVARLREALPSAHSVCDCTVGTRAQGNTVDGNAVNSSALQPKPAANVKVYDLMTLDKGARAAASPLSPQTRFLKSWWPVPTAFVDAADHGCPGAADSSSCVQATIDAAAAKGNGAAAYFPPGLYSVNTTIVVKPGNYTVLGSGFQTRFQWSNPAAHATPAVMHVQGGGAGLRLEQFQVLSGQNAQAFDTKLLHDGHAAAVDAQPEAGGRLTTYDGVYTGTGGGDVWNATGVHVKDLPTGDIVHFIHVDGACALYGPRSCCTLSAHPAELCGA